MVQKSWRNPFTTNLQSPVLQNKIFHAYFPKFAGNCRIKKYEH